MNSIMCKLRCENSSPLQDGGCPVEQGDGVCGEANSLHIIKEFRRMYEEKMAIIEEGGCDCFQDKLKLQQDWINDLTHQNEMLINVVQELEYEATEKVQILEEKLQETEQCICDAKRTLSDNDRTIQELRQKVNYYSSFGDVESMAQQLRCRNEECESLRQDLSKNKQCGVTVDQKYVQHVELQLQDFLKEKNEMKKRKKDLEKKVSAQCKEKEQLRCECLNLKDQILNLQNEIQVLRCDKSISEKFECECERLKYKVEQMQKEMEEYENLKHRFEKIQNEKCECQRLICRIECLEKENDTVRRKNEKLLEDNQNNINALVALNEENRSLSNAVDNMRRKNDMTSVLTSKEIFQLNSTIAELQTNLEQTRFIQDQEEKSYQDTIENLNQTIFKLGDQLTSVFNKCTSDKSVTCLTKGKNKVSFAESQSVQVNLRGCAFEKELNEVLDINAKMTKELKRKSGEMDCLKEKIASLETALASCEERAANLQQAVDLSLNSIELLVTSEEQINNEYWLQTKDYELLQDLSVSLEMEHFENLQTIELLDCQVHKYKMMLKNKENENSVQKDEYKKLSKQKKCYEDIVTYFKNEICIMADQLTNLQELLTISNESAQQESQKYINAFMEMQTLNSKLSEQLCLCQQDMNSHDETIDTIREKLHSSMLQNQELQETIIQLNETIIELQHAVKIHEKENSSITQSARECKQKLERCNQSLEGLKHNLEEKSLECDKFKQAYFNEKKAVKDLQNELDLTQRKLQDSHFDVISAMEDLKEKLATTEDSYNKLTEDHKEIQAQLARSTRKEAVKDQEIKRYRKIVGDLKITLMDLNSELNKTWCQKELRKKCKKAKGCNCSSTGKKADQATESDICPCPCEVEFYQNMVDTLKNAITDLQSKLSNAEAINKKLEDQIKQKDEQIKELRNVQQLKSREHQECSCVIKKLESELEATKQNEKKYEDLARRYEKEINQLRQEVQSKSKQLNEESKKCKEINSSKCIQLVRVQEELHHLKEEMAVLLKRHAAFNKEADKLRTENAQLEYTVQCLRDRSKGIQEELIQYQTEVCALTGERNQLIRTNRELLNEVKTLQQSCYGQKINNQQRSPVDEAEKNEICTESKNVLSNVQAWINEQKKIITFMMGKQNNYALENKHLKEQILELQSRKVSPQRSPPKPIDPAQPGYSRQQRQTEVVSPVSLGSQGMASIYDPDSLPASPCQNDMSDWYSTNFRSESEYTDEDEEVCVSKVRNLTQQMKNSNKMWKKQNRCSGYSNPDDYGVSRDKK